MELVNRLHLCTVFIRFKHKCNTQKIQHVCHLHGQVLNAKWREENNYRQYTFPIIFIIIIGNWPPTTGVPCGRGGTVGVGAGNQHVVGGVVPEASAVGVMLRAAVGIIYTATATGTPARIVRVHGGWELSPLFFIPPRYQAKERGEGRVTLPNPYILVFLMCHGVDEVKKGVIGKGF